MKVTDQTTLKYESQTGLVTNADESITVFDTTLPTWLQILTGRETIPMAVIIQVLLIWGDPDLTFEDLDEYLLNEAEITQDEREIIVEGLYNFKEIVTHKKHCNQGDYIDVCKYGENDTCPMLPENDTCPTLAERRAESGLQNAINDIRDHIIGYVETPKGLELLLPDNKTMTITKSLGYKVTHWGESCNIKIHRFPNGMNMNQIMSDPLVFSDWYNKNIGES